MNITKPTLVEVVTAKHTATEGILDLTISVTNYLGNTEARTIPYTWDTNEEYMAGEPYDLGLSIATWFAAHEDFEVGEYVPSEEPPAEPLRDVLAELDALTVRLARAEKLEAALIEKGTLTKDDIDKKATKARP